MGKKIPFPHQEKGRKYLKDRYSGFLHYKMRMGKTFTSILSLKDLNEYPVLIICPKIVNQVWYNELLDEGAKPDAISVMDHSAKKKNIEALNKNSHITICNFEKAKNYKVLTARKWRIIIIDEIHRLANADSQVTRYFRKNPRPVYQRRWGLTGTPAPETPLNLVTQYLIVYGEFMGYKTYNQYLLDHWVKNQYSGKWEPIIPQHVDAIVNYVKNTACIATMDDIGKGARFVYTTRYVPMNSTQRALYEKSEKVFKMTSTGPNEDGFDPAKMVRRLQQKLISAGVDPFNDHAIISDYKAKACVEYWEYIQEPMLVVSAYREPMIPVIEAFEKAGARVGVIHGDVSYKDREKIRERIMNGYLDVVVAQTKSIEVGLNFSICNTLMVIANSDSGGSREQLVERINHMEATSPKEIIDVFSVGSNDTTVMDGLESKGKTSMRYFK